MNIETSSTPPDVADDEDDGDGVGTSVHLSISEPDGTHRLAHEMSHSRDVGAVADAIVGCVRGLAAHHGPELQLALARRLTIH